MRIVADASALIDAITDGGRRDAALRAIEAAEVWVPQHVDVEVASAVARLERGGAITTADAEQAIALWQSMPVERADLSALTERAWSMRSAIRVSDAFYVGLAALLGCPLVTSDVRLSRSPVTGVTFTVIR